MQTDRQTKRQRQKQRYRQTERDIESESDTKRWREKEKREKPIVRDSNIREIPIAKRKIEKRDRDSQRT